MSARKPVHLVPTNIKAEELVMDIRGGGRGSRYYCLPPMHFTTASSGGGGGKGYAFHLVAQGHVLGVFDNWVEAKASLTGYPDSSNRGYDTVEECIEAWQALCRLGIHPHPADPAPALASAPPTSATSTSSTSSSTSTASTSTSLRDSKQPRPATGGRTRRANTKSPPPSPRKVARSTQSAEASGEFVNFVIRGEGIVSSSAERTEDRYREMQRRGEEPDLLITRSFREATFFAVDEE
ncbi:hypothetical protein C8R46DRAFT_1044679 [Mycena filopes]|nr:hypothetical protein C8R46DRAFT_1044679 [Mycena filopes]